MNRPTTFVLGPAREEVEMLLENKNALVYGAGGNPSEIRTFAKGGRQERRNRDQRAAGEETDHDGG